MNCKVMKCQSKATMVHKFQFPDAPIHEMPICGIHEDLISRGGAEYLYEASADTPGGTGTADQIVMGDDLLGLHEYVVKDLGLATVTGRCANDPDDLGTVFELVVRRRGEPDDSSISLVFRGDSGPRLVKLMALLGLADEDPS